MKLECDQGMVEFSKESLKYRNMRGVYTDDFVSDLMLLDVLHTLHTSAMKSFDCSK